MKWVITGVSRLTGERDVISSPHPKEEARRLMSQATERQHRFSAYYHLRLEPAVREGNLW